MGAPVKWPTVLRHPSGPSIATITTIEIIKTETVIYLAISSFSIKDMLTICPEETCLHH